jgi:cation:H+ antiporter
MAYVLILLGFIVLIKGADLLVDGASTLARRFHIPDLVIGLSIVAFGTSAPELFVNITASIKGTAGIAVGNIVGSTIANILLVLGTAAVIYPLSVTKRTVSREIPLSVFAALILAFFVSDRLLFAAPASVLSRPEAFILLVCFVFFMFFSFRISRDVTDLAEEVPQKKYSTPVSFLLIVVGLCGLLFGGQWIVSGALSVAAAFNVSDSLVGLTIVALGTSLPELATAVVAAFKKNPDLAIGGIVGSNIFNIFFVLGISGLIRPLEMPATATVDLAVMIAANIFLFVAMFTGGKRLIDRWEGFAFLFAYCGYMVFLIIQG